MHVRLDRIQLEDRYGTFVSGKLTGRLPADLATDSNFPEGLQANLELLLKLQPLMQQPALKGMTSIMDGSLKLDLSVDGASDYPIDLQGAINGLRARGMPGSRQNYRIGVKAQQPSPESASFGVNLVAGKKSSRSTQADLNGTVSFGQAPLAFDLDLKSKRMRQSDLSLLAAAFSPSGEEGVCCAGCAHAQVKS